MWLRQGIFITFITLILNRKTRTQQLAFFRGTPAAYAS